MKSFTVYDNQSGVILRTGFCPQDAFDLQATSTNEALLEGSGNAATQRVDPDTKQLVAIQ